MPTEGSAGDDEPTADGGTPRVLLDVMCGKLATYLRMCGYDAAYALDRGVEADDRLLSLAADEERTLITRDRELAARADDAVLLTERDVLDQLRELAAAGYPVALADEPTRCGACNGRVERVDAEGGDDGVDAEGGDDGDADPPEYVPNDRRPAWRCRDCGRWFWKGSHWESVADRLAEV